MNPGIAAVMRAPGIPLKTMRHLQKIGRKLLDELREFSDARAARIKELGEEVLEDVDGEKRPTGNWRVKLENVDEFNAEQQDLLDEAVEIDLPVVKDKDLGDKVVGITAADLLACEAFIEE